MSQRLPRHPDTVPGDFYVEQECCLSCGVPITVAPDLIGQADDGWHCLWKKQPSTPEELDQAIEIFRQQETNCHRYAGNDPNILSRIDPEFCDQA